MNVLFMKTQNNQNGKRESERRAEECKTKGKKNKSPCDVIAVANSEKKQKQQQQHSLNEWKIENNSINKEMDIERKEEAKKE